MNIGWPEGILSAMMFINLLANAALDGKPRDYNHSFGLCFMGQSLSFALLYWGGFFS